MCTLKNPLLASYSDPYYRLDGLYKIDNYTHMGKVEIVLITNGAICNSGFKGLNSWLVDCEFIKMVPVNDCLYEK